MTRRGSSPEDLFSPRLRPVVKALRQQGRQTVLFHQTLAERVGLNATDSRVLSYVTDAGSAAAGELARLTGLTTGAVTRIIDRLERAGFVRREADPGDRRKVIVVPVADGERRQEMGRLFASFGRAVGVQLERYTDAELEVIRRFATESVELLRTETEKLLEGDDDRRPEPE